GRPGILKTPALTEALKPLNRLAVEGRDQYRADAKDHELNAMIRQAQRKLLEKQIEAAIKSGKDPAILKEESARFECPEPTERRYILNDPTIEKLGVILNQNPNGV